MDIKLALQTAQSRVEQQLKTILATQSNTDEKLIAATSYSLLNGGKRLRPFLVYLTGEMLNADLDDLNIIAAAIECIHSYSLIHDDLPAMDDDALRRGNPTCHIAYDEATAILAGDALQTLAFELLASQSFNKIGPTQQVSLIACLAKASGLQGMCGGQALDIAATSTQVTLDELERIHQLKTGALLSASVQMGALCSKECTDEILSQLAIFSTAIGLAFQVQDDILDIEGDTQVLGKPQGSDLAANKATYPALLGLSGAKDKAKKLYQEAIFALEKIPADTSRLQALAAYIIERDH